jgi:hypothetical protein
VKSVNYKLSTSAYLKLGETNVFIKKISIHSLTPSPSHFPSPSFTPIQCVRADAGERPRLYNPRPHSYFLLFLSFAFSWSCGICLATPISTCKGREGHKHFEGDPLAFFAKQKFKGCIYPLHACVFSYAGVYVKIFKHCRRRNRRPFLGICRCHGFFGGWCGPIELY